MVTAAVAQVLDTPGHARTAWCQDFLLTGGVSGRGSCCRRDDELAAWCAFGRVRHHVMLVSFVSLHLLLCK